MLKKYGIGLMAFIIAVFAAAFTNPVPSRFGTKLFRYSAPSGSYSVANVETRGNWTFVTGTPNCPLNVDQKACEMDVDDGQINPDNTLKSSFTISAHESQPNISYVTSITNGTIHNKSF